MLPNSDDGEFIQGLIKHSAKRDAGGFASWIAPPKVGINNKPGDFEYVKFED
jgi:benzoyl-CoA 2,3-dioxygenase component B